MSAPQQQTSVDRWQQQDALRSRTIMTHLSDFAGQIINAFPETMRKADPGGKRFMQIICQLRNSPGMANIAPIEFAIGAVRAASFGLDMDPMLGQLYLVPYGKKLQPILGYRGLITKAYRSGVIKDISANVVFPGEHFIYRLGDNPLLEHIPDIDKDNSKATPRAAYAIANTAEDGVIRVVLPAWEIFQRRDRSSAVKYAARTNANKQPGEDLIKTPWDTDQNSMFRKTAVRALSSFLPMDKCRELAEALEKEDQYEKELSEGTVINVTPEPSPDTPRKVIMADFTDEELASFEKEVFPVLGINRARFQKAVQDYDGDKAKFVSAMMAQVEEKKARRAEQTKSDEGGDQ